MYKKVLLPVSGEQRCKRASIALKKALEVCDGEIVLLHVTTPIPNTVGGEAREELLREDTAKGLMAMSPIIEQLEASGRPFHTLVMGGHPDECIVRAADEENADLIVMFTDGRDGIGDMFLGSITERVLRNAGIDLLAVRGQIK